MYVVMELLGIRWGFWTWSTAPPTQSFTRKYLFFLFAYRAHHSILWSNYLVFHNLFTSFPWPRWIQNYFLPSCQWVGKRPNAFLKSGRLIKMTFLPVIPSWTDSNHFIKHYNCANLPSISVIPTVPHSQLHGTGLLILTLHFSVHVSWPYNISGYRLPTSRLAKQAGLKI